ncbi:mercuric ion transporter MerT, partial [Klebsiella pneumoniae]
MSEPQNGRGALFAGGLAAILASTCCLGPLVLVALGFSGAWIGNLTVLEPYRPLFIGAALVALFFAWKRIYRGTVAKLAMRQPFVLFKGLTFQKLCL